MFLSRGRRPLVLQPFANSASLCHFLYSTSVIHSVILRRRRRPLIFKNFVSNDSLHFHPLLALLPSYLHREEELAWRVFLLLLLQAPPLFLLLRPMQVLILLMKTTHCLLRMLPAIFTSSPSFSRCLCPLPPLFFLFFFALFVLTSVSSALVFR